MCQQKFLSMNVYRILFVIGCFDILSMIPNSILPGYWLITAQSYCQSPLLNLYLGALCFPAWAAYVGLNISLVTNRLVDFTWPKLQETLFGGKMIILWTGLPILYGLFLYCQFPSMLYYPKTGSYYFGADPEKAQTPLFYPISDAGVAGVMMLLNLLMIRAMYIRNLNMMSNLQKVVREKV
ncbi:unnamed protein product, partial [Mesorhabditis belari]|uniref:Uncharacterized protein n=1 Tax=Mesorhabditis belari TaxID=2138241 RepID=A0AAF3FNZ9_9BILA